MFYDKNSFNAVMKGAGGVTEEEQQPDKNCKDVEANKNQS
jgi:hypothetical protein